VYVALFFALGGTSIAAVNALPKNSVGSPQIKNGSIQKIDISKRTVSAMRGLRGATGGTGATGPTGVVTTKAFFGSVATIANTSAVFVFVGPTAMVSTTAGQAIVGSAEASLGQTAAASNSIG
jgi:hypothetical protein